MLSTARLTRNAGPLHGSTGFDLYKRDSGRHDFASEAFGFGGLKSDKTPSGVGELLS